MLSLRDQPFGVLFSDVLVPHVIERPSAHPIGRSTRRSQTHDSMQHDRTARGLRQRNHERVDYGECCFPSGCMPYSHFVDPVNGDIDWIKVIFRIDQRLPSTTESAIPKDSDTDLTDARKISISGFHVYSNEVHIRLARFFQSRATN
jgi:hypothetical protein